LGFFGFQIDFEFCNWISKLFGKSKNFQVERKIQKIDILGFFWISNRFQTFGNLKIKTLKTFGKVQKSKNIGLNEKFKKYLYFGFFEFQIDFSTLQLDFKTFQKIQKYRVERKIKKYRVYHLNKMSSILGRFSFVLF
jgi:hypothetical protein